MLFIAYFLDSRMQYSEAHFETPEMSLDDAQAEKLDWICRSLQLKPGERFLDVGCGWGGLIVWAAERYGAVAHGCTLSAQQLQFAHNLIKNHGLQDRASVKLCNYLDTQAHTTKSRRLACLSMLAGRICPRTFERSIRSSPVVVDF
jgi:cyclopropane-fatty-acyl-phospholipid synthase